ERVRGRHARRPGARDGGSPPGRLRRVSHGGGRAACACRGSGSLAEGGRTESGSLGDDRTAHRATCNWERATGLVARCLGGGGGSSEGRAAAVGDAGRGELTLRKAR